MESYTIEDIEIIRQKSGLSYQDAVALLDYHNGNLARALIDLERNGRLKDTGTSGTGSVRSVNPSAERGLPGLLNRLFRFRLKITRNNTPIINLSVLFSALVIFIAPKLAAFSGILALLLGCNFSFDKNDGAFAGEDLQKMVRNAGENAKNSVNNVAKNFSFSVNFDQNKEKAAEAPSEKTPASDPAPVRESVREINVTADPVPESDETAAEKSVESYFAGNPAVAHGTAFSADSSVPTIQVPVQVESSEGSVTVEEQNDGYSTLTVG